MNSIFFASALALVLLGTGGTANAQLVNGDFETGDFTGWTLISTPNGGSSFTQVGSFDTAGTGTTSDSAIFEVGEVSGGVGGGGLGQGAGISQNVLLLAGQLNVFLNIAATSDGNNADGGTFELFLDGNDVANHAFGGIGVNQILRSTLSYSGTVTAGTHNIAIEMFRGYGTEYPNTPFQYLDNITLSGSAAPEPSATALAMLGLAVLAITSARSGHSVKKFIPGKGLFR